MLCEPERQTLLHMCIKLMMVRLHTSVLLRAGRQCVNLSVTLVQVL